MRRPNFQEEKKLWRKGYKSVACLDEAGRGPLAGPVVAAAVVIINQKSKIKNQAMKTSSSSSYFAFLQKVRVNENLKFKILLKEIRDSKKLTPKKREKFYKTLTSHSGIEWGIGWVSEKIIDKINILEATKLAMKKAIEKLDKKPDFLILDGNFKINLPVSKKSITRASAKRRDETQVSSIVKADEKVFSCAVASIIAKVWRDRTMKRYGDKYPQYGFAQHKGYSTKLHRKMLKKHGLCQIYRKTFKPVTRAKRSRREIRSLLYLRPAPQAERGSMRGGENEVFID